MTALAEAARARSRASVLAWVLAGVMVLVAAVCAAGLAGPPVAPKLARAGGATIALCVVCGYAPARLLVPRAMAPHFPLLVPLVGAACAGLALTLIGVLHVSFGVSLPLVLAAFAVAGGAARLRLGPVRADHTGAGGFELRVLAPLIVAAAIAAVAVMPVSRIGYATVLGQNPDAHMSVGSAYFLQHAPPGTVRASLPLDKVPDVWQSKYPIYYFLAGASSLSGLNPIQTFATVSAMVLALTALAFLVLARYGLGGGPWGALAAMGAVGIDRLLLYLAIHPYYNQLWGTLALPLTLAFGLRFLRSPSRGDGVLVLLFGALGAFAYPLMLPFPAGILGLAAIGRWRALEPERRRALRGRARSLVPRRRIAWVPLAIVALPAALLLAVGVVAKAAGATHVLVPGSDLRAWSGDLPDAPPFPGFFGFSGSNPAAWLGALTVIAAAAYGLRRVTRDARVPLAVVAAGAFAYAAWFAARDFGGYLYFKDLAFLAPLLITCAAVGLSSAVADDRLAAPARAAAGAVAAIVAVALVAVSMHEIRGVGTQLPRPLLGLKGWNDRLPAGASIRLDLKPDGAQLWAAYLLDRHPLTTPTPVLGTTYPSAPQGLKADYALTVRGQRPVGARGAPVLANSAYRVYRLSPSLPGPDRSSRRMVDGVPGAGGGA